MNPTTSHPHSPFTPFHHPNPTLLLPNPTFIIFPAGKAAGKHQRHPCGLAWLREAALAVEETPDYLAAVKVKLSNPGVGREGWALGEARKHLPQAAEGSTTHGAAPGCPAGLSGFPGMKGSRGCPGRRRGRAGQTSAAHPSAPVRLPEPPWDKSNREGKGGKSVRGGAGGAASRGEKRERKGSTRERKNQIKGRNSSEITELFIFPAASGDFFFFSPFEAPQAFGAAPSPASLLFSGVPSPHPRHKATCSLHHTALLGTARPFDLRLCCVYM